MWFFGWMCLIPLRGSFLAESPEPFLNRIVATLKAGLVAVDEAIQNGYLHLEEGVIRMHAMKAATRPPALDSFKTTLFAAIGSTQLPNMLLDIDSDTHFSWILLGRPPSHELLAVYGALLAHGTALSAAAVSKRIPELDEEQIRRWVRLLEAEGAVAEVEYQHRHSVTQHWCREILHSCRLPTLQGNSVNSYEILHPRSGIPSENFTP